MSKSRLLVLLALFALPLPALALCTLLCWCTASTGSVAFGVYNPLSASPHDGVGNVRVSCGGVLGLLVPYQVALDKGANSSAFSPRKLAGGASRINYDLYADVSRTTLWGDGTGGTQTVDGSVSIVLLGGTAQDHPVYGRIPGSQTGVPPGSYVDTVHVTVTYQ